MTALDEQLRAIRDRWTSEAEDAGSETEKAKAYIRQWEEMADVARSQGDTERAKQYDTYAAVQKEKYSPLLLQEDIAKLQEQGPSDEYMQEYEKSLGWNVGRGQDLERALGAHQASAAQQDAATQMYRRYAGGGAKIAPLLMRAKQNELAQQAAAMRAGRGAMGARNSMMQAAGIGGQIANQGVGNMVTEDMQNQLAAQKALGLSRQGAIRSENMMSGLERDDDIYRHGRAKQAMDWLGMAANEKATYGNTLLNLLNATKQGNAPGPSTAGQIIQGVATAGMHSIPQMMNSGSGGGGAGWSYKGADTSSAPGGLLDQALMSRPG